MIQYRTLASSGRRVSGLLRYAVIMPSERCNSHLKFTPRMLFGLWAVLATLVVWFNAAWRLVKEMHLRFVTVRAATWKCH